MSLYNFEQLSSHELVLNYLIEVRGKGFFFSHSDLKYIKDWLALCPSTEELLVILADESDRYFGINQAKNTSPKKTLYGLNKIILRKIKERAMLGFRAEPQNLPLRAHRDPLDSIVAEDISHAEA